MRTELFDEFQKACDVASLVEFNLGQSDLIKNEDGKRHKNDRDNLS